MRKSLTLGRKMKRENDCSIYSKTYFTFLLFTIVAKCNWASTTLAHSLQNNKSKKLG
jgi:hypothetical protein